MHSECVNAAPTPARRSKLASVARIVGAVVVVVGLGTCVCVKSISSRVDSKRKQAQADAQEIARLKAVDHEGLRLDHEEACPKLRDVLKDGQCEARNAPYGLILGTNVHATVSCLSDKTTFNEVIKSPMKPNPNDVFLWSEKTMCTAYMFREDGGVVPTTMAAKVKKALDSL